MNSTEVSGRRVRWLAVAAAMALLGMIAMVSIFDAAADHDVMRLMVSVAWVPASWWLARGALNRAASPPSEGRATP